MNQKWSRRPVYQMENGYETRIRYLEEVVQLLISRTNSAPTSIMSTAPQAISFRYSADRGLVPLLSETTARSLAMAQSVCHTLSYRTPGEYTNRHPSPSIASLANSSASIIRSRRKPKRDTCRSPPSSCAAGASLSSIISPIGPSSKLRERNSHVRSSSLDRFRASASIDTASVSKTIATAQDPMSPLLDPPTLDAALEHLGSNNHIVETSSREVIHIDHPISMVSPTQSLFNDSSLDSSDQTAAPIALSSVSAPIVGSPDSDRPFSLASLPTRSSTIINASTDPVYPILPSPEPIQPRSIDSSSTSSKDSPLATITTKPADPELAPDLSQSALEHYNDIDTYLELSGAIKTKKKKKKKKKASNSSVPSQPVDEPIAAVGSMSVMDEEELDPLERKNDPRYRPIEDSEFVGWGECIDSPTATPNNPILFYV
ncbi:hypothetical protein MJO28_005998 [Puccinia striiformis f. sp. tritici]|uniref:Uncharacterized protein n=1 Tax=Puccinia striiformis f. sp. tritici TaxID=168172 RepID=A0ACC0EHQ8_9BASI|nr:hypothetical protein MJO28_005998 [Puccinia striiformis f. sp. tritici]